METKRIKEELERKIAEVKQRQNEAGNKRVNEIGNAYREGEMFAYKSFLAFIKNNEEVA